jgi:hypothetical protein
MYSVIPWPHCLAYRSFIITLHMSKCAIAARISSELHPSFILWRTDSWRLIDVKQAPVRQDFLDAACGALNMAPPCRTYNKARKRYNAASTSIHPSTHRAKAHS